MNRKRVYLDTNIIADRKLRKNKAIIIESIIGEMSKYCSAFVVSEHKRTFLQTMRYLWTLLNEKKDCVDVLNYIQNQRQISNYKKNRCRKVLNWITDNGIQPHRHALRRLETLIFTYDHFFFGDMDVLESDVGCPLSWRKIGSRREIEETLLVCPRTCSLSDFLEKQKSNLIEIEKNIRGLQHMGLIHAVLERVIKNPEYRDSICRDLADVVIVLEAPDYCVVCSNNIKDFEPICTALGKEFLPIRY